MPITIQAQEQVHLTSVFVDADPVTGDAFPIAIESVTVTISKWDPVAATPGWAVTVGPIAPNANLATGEVFYDWVPTSDGKYKVVFQATVQASTNSYSTHTRIIFVGPLATTKTLAASKTYQFLGAVSPLYVDPEEVLKYYPEGDIVEVTEWVHWYSKELKNLLELADDATLTTLQHDFIIASAMCALSRIYGINGILGGSSNSDSFTLGDLQVKNQTSSGISRSGSNKYDPTTWCEYAAILREELTRSNSTPVSFVKAGSWYSPIPVRALRRFD